jgi:arylsulfatase A-like enzyme
MMRSLPAALALVAFAAPSFATDQSRPNVVIVFADDMGYGDLGCYGNKAARTPHLDRMAVEGTRWTSFYVPQAVCSASRTALLTGCYPNRLGILGALNPQAQIGISDNEMTLGQLFKSRGYATAIFGKWHLGHHPQFLPPRHGFDEYLGLPYSNDMGPKPASTNNPPVPLIDGEKTIEQNPDVNLLTRRYTERAIAFIEKNKDRPFFLYVPHTMPHVPLGVSPKFAGKSGTGIYGDVLMEIDWSVGEILAALKRNGLDDNTFVIFASDNGPWLTYGNHGGTAGPLREGKGTEFEGGVREPCIMRWPGKVPPGRVLDTPAMTIDMFPTFAKLIGAELPKHPIDGKDIGPLVFGKPGATSPQEAYYFYWNRELQAVRSGKWKLHFPHEYRHVGEKRGADGKAGGQSTAKIGLALYDLEVDVGETTNVAEKHPDVVGRLKALAEKERDELGDSLTQRQGKGVRPPGRLAAK